MPNITVPAAATGLPSFSRRNFIRALGATGLVGSTAAGAAISHASAPPDAELIALGEELDRQIARYMEHFDILATSNRRFEAEVQRRGGFGALGFDGWIALRTEIGTEDLIAEGDDLLEQISGILDRIIATPAEGLRGLAVKARGFAWEVALDFGQEDEEVRAERRSVRAFLGEIERVAAVL